MAYKCKWCGSGWNDSCKCHENHKHGDKWIVICDKLGCDEPSCGKSIYGLGYLASVCQKHYDEASWEDKHNAERFRYAE